MRAPATYSLQVGKVPAYMYLMLGLVPAELQPPDQTLSGPPFEPGPGSKGNANIELFLGSFAFD